jgi:hypothetical protein
MLISPDVIRSYTCWNLMEVEKEAIRWEHSDPQG